MDKSVAKLFCIRMKTSFSSVVIPSPPNNVAKHFVGVYLFPTLKKGEGGGEGREATYLSQIYTKEKGW